MPNFSGKSSNHQTRRSHTYCTVCWLVGTRSTGAINNVPAFIHSIAFLRQQQQQQQQHILCRYTTANGSVDFIRLCILQCSARTRLMENELQNDRSRLQLLLLLLLLWLNRLLFLRLIEFLLDFVRVWNINRCYL